MADWNDFYIAVASASAALTGLIFVGISISLTKILTIPGLADRALLSLILLVNVLTGAVATVSSPKSQRKNIGYIRFCDCHIYLVDNLSPRHPQY